MIPERVGIKINNKRVVYNYGRMVVLSSDKYLAWERQAEFHVLQAKKRFNCPITGLIEAHFEFYFKNHQGEADTSNCIEGPQDLIQKIGVIENDKFIVSLKAIKYFGTEPHTIIRLYSYDIKVEDGISD